MFNLKTHKVMDANLIKVNEKTNPFAQAFEGYDPDHILILKMGIECLLANTDIEQPIINTERFNAVMRLSHDLTYVLSLMNRQNNQPKQN